MDGTAQQISNVREQELERLMRAYGTSIFRTCYSYLRDAALAEDAGQDTFVKAFKKLDTVCKITEREKKAWLLRIAINTCKDYRKNAWFRHVERHPETTSAMQHNDRNIEEDCTVAKAIMELRAKQKEVILLFYYHDMSYDEIAKTLGISQAAVHSRLVSAKKELRRTLEGWRFNEDS